MGDHYEDKNRTYIHLLFHVIVHGGARTFTLQMSNSTKRNITQNKELW